MFSAVLSAFLVAVYPNLQPQTADQTLRVLERIQAQTASYRMESGYLNATMSPSPDPFQPSYNDIIVNVLWFASLIVSLVTASFGILVKQWLHEYLAVEIPSPQARLRVRHLRYPSLRKWKVFEIAAALPLLLQIALGLFFVGLCSLTTSVHPSVYHTTLPLVIGWAFCISVAILLPVFYPHCPYRTTFLQPLHLLRRGLILACYVLYIIAMTPLAPLFFIPKFKIEYVLPSFFRAVIIQAVNGSINRETEAISNEDADAEILAAVDAIQSNDDLLATTIAESLEQMQPSFPTIMTFIVRVVHNRLQTPDEIGVGAPIVLDLRGLSRRSMAFVLDLACHSFNNLLEYDVSYKALQGSPPASEENTEMVWLFALLLSPSRVQLPSEANLLIANVFLRQAPRFCAALVDGCFVHQENDGYLTTSGSGDNRVLLLIQQLKTNLLLVNADFDATWSCLVTTLKALFRHVRARDPASYELRHSAYYELYRWMERLSDDLQNAIQTWLFELVHSAFPLTSTTTLNSLAFRDALMLASYLETPYSDRFMGVNKKLLHLFRLMLDQSATASLFVNTFVWPSEPGKAYTGFSNSQQMRILINDVYFGVFNIILTMSFRLTL